jgi:hypothetical protein
MAVQLRAAIAARKKIKFLIAEEKTPVLSAFVSTF